MQQTLFSVFHFSLVVVRGSRSPHLQAHMVHGMGRPAPFRTSAMVAFRAATAARGAVGEVHGEALRAHRRPIVLMAAPLPDLRRWDRSVPGSPSGSPLGIVRRGRGAILMYLRRRLRMAHHPMARHLTRGVRGERPGCRAGVACALNRPHSQSRPVPTSHLGLNQRSAGPS